MPRDTPQSQTIAIDAPIEGWDAFSSLDSMPPTAAIILDNWIPGAGSCETRKGNVLYCTIGTGPVETIASLTSASATKLVAATGGGLFDITDQQNPITLKALLTYANSRWQTENFRKADESGVLILCNGSDSTQIFNGTTVTTISTSGTDVGLNLTP